jgi:hypothetical protein
MTMNSDLKDVLARLLGPTDERQPGDEVIRARLAALLAEGETETETLPAEIWSAYLTGQLDPEARSAVQSRLARSPGLLREAASIAGLLEEIEANPARIPQDLAAEATSMSRQVFAVSQTAMSSGLQRSLAALGLHGGRVSGIRGALDIVLGQGRQACEIVLNTAADLLQPDPGAWSFAATPALVTRSSSGASAVVEGVREADAASMTIIADRFEGSRRIEIVIQGLSAEQAPTVLVASEDDQQPPMRLEPSVEADTASGSVRLRYEVEDLPAGRYAVLIYEPDTSSSATRM